MSAIVPTPCSAANEADTENGIQTNHPERKPSTLPKLPKVSAGPALGLASREGRIRSEDLFRRTSDDPVPQYYADDHVDPPKYQCGAVELALHRVSLRALF